MENKKIRYAFMGSVVMVSLILGAFLVLVNMNRMEELKSIMGALGILFAFMMTVLLIFFLKGNLYDVKGKLEKTRILTMTTTIFVIAQISFAFATYANQRITMAFHATEDAKSIYQFCADCLENDKDIKETYALISNYIDQYDEFETAFLAEREEDYYRAVVLFDENVEDGMLFQQQDVSLHVFPLKQYYLCIKELKEYEHSKIWDALSELLTVMAASIFLTIELMLFVIKIIDEKVNPVQIIDGKKPMRALSYVRQLAFLFYFASCLPSAFISVMAKSLGGSFLGITGNVLAGIPQSVETLLTCTAIFGTSILIERKGWKLPFSSGLLLVSIGNIFTALSGNILFFICSRAIVGLGYGFCWMTFRNFALFGRNEEEKTAGFSLLNAGLYAGIDCGSVLGAVLAEKLGYQVVLFIAAGFTLLCSASVIKMENQRYKKVVEKVERKEKITSQMISVLVMYIVLMIAPTCIAGAFLSYYLPLYFTSIGRGIADAGRAQLLYGVLVIYAGPALGRLVGKRPNYFTWNVLYNVIIGVAFIVFGLMGQFLPAFLAVIILSLGDSFGFVVQNIYFTRIQAVERMGDSMSMSLVSFLKKMAEMLGPIVFGLVMSGAGTFPVCILGIVFVVFAGIYYVRVQYFM